MELAPITTRPLNQSPSAPLMRLSSPRMSTFDRFDICAAHAALESDWNRNGMLRERPSNARRRESTAVQLRRMGYRPAPSFHGGFEGLESDNQREIYVNALQAFGLRPGQHDPITKWLKS